MPLILCYSNLLEQWFLKVHVYPFSWSKQWNPFWRRTNSFSPSDQLTSVWYKEVLLRVRKRHTARCVASARAVPPDRGGGLSSPDRVGGAPIKSRQGVTSIQSQWGGNLPHLYLSGSIGVPPPRRGVDWQTENSTFPHPSDAGGKNPETTNWYLEMIGTPLATSKM